MLSREDSLFSLFNNLCIQIFFEAPPRRLVSVRVYLLHYGIGVSRMLSIDAVYPVLAEFLPVIVKRSRLLPPLKLWDPRLTVLPKLSVAEY